MHFRQFFEQPVEGVRLQARRQALAGALAAHGIDHVIAFAPFGHHPGDHLGRMLEIGVDGNHRIAGGVGQARGQGRLLAEIAREDQQLDAGIGFVPDLQLGDAVILAAVVDADHLESFAGLLEHRDQPGEETVDIEGFVVDGNDDGQQRMALLT